MPLYVYRCRHCGPTDVAFPIGQAAAEVPCPACGNPASRSYTPPRLGRPDSPLARALRAEEASAYEPRTVPRVPPAARRLGSTADSRQARLPRP
jgi:putative FmdB family regulatory protein